jgi:hypothetical protein
MKTVRVRNHLQGLGWGSWLWHSIQDISNKRDKTSYILRVNYVSRTQFDLWDFKFSRRRVWSSASTRMYCRVLNWMSTDVSEVRATCIIRTIMEAARISETSVDFQLRTRRYIPEDSELHTVWLAHDLNQKNAWHEQKSFLCRVL